MAFKSKLVALTSSDADIYELPATYDGAILLYLVNSQNAVRDVTVKFRKQSTGATTTLGVFPVVAQTAWQYPVKFAMEEGDKVIASCSASGVTAYATVIVADLTPISNVFNPRGAWSGAATYAPMDVVSSSRNSYLALAGNTNDLPPSFNWMLLAQGGADGATGAPGSGSVGSTGTIVANRIAVYNDTTGNVLKDGGKTVTDFATAAQGAKVDLLTVTGATNLDTMRTTVAALGTASTKATGTAAGNVPVLDGSGLLDAAVLPGLAITDVNVVASQAAMLALTAQKGDIAVRSDLNKSFALSTNSPTTLADWKELLTPTDVITSVNAKTGTVVLNPDDLSDASSTNKFASATSVAAIAHAATSKATPVDADEIGLIDSAASNVLKKLTWANLKATLKSTAAFIWGGTNDATFLTAKNAADSNAFVTLTSSTSIGTDASTGYNFFITLAHNTTLANPTNLIDGRTYQWLVQQDGTGSRTMAFGTTFEFTAAPTLSTAAGKRDLIVATYHAASGKLIASFRKGS